MKRIVIVLLIVISLTQCTMTPAQQDVAVKTATLVTSKIDKQGRLTQVERDLIKSGVIAATSPKDRNAAALIKVASETLNAAVRRGAIDQTTADEIDLALSIAGMTFGQ